MKEAGCPGNSFKWFGGGVDVAPARTDRPSDRDVKARADMWAATVAGIAGAAAAANDV